jgi:ribosomal protein S12 methylthiotransferase accessory factor
MSITNLSSKFKDEGPLKTVAKIKSILMDLDINTFEENWEKINDNCYSVRIEIDGLTGVGTNGKGTSREYALASAYAELMERLQNRKTLKKVYCTKQKEELSFPDEKLFNIEEFMMYEPNFKVIIQNFDKQKFINLITEFKSLRFCVPYFNINNQEVQYLPDRILNLAVGTNGMCAGNTKEEALVGGISEVMERYVMKQIVLNDLILPEISETKIKDVKIRELIDFLRNKGFTIIIKDCSLNGRFPVMGVLVLNKNKTKYHFKLGAFPIAEIAIERCLTEMFQGYNLLSQKCFQDVNLKIIKYTNDERKYLIRQNAISRGQFPNSIFVSMISKGEDEKAFLYDLKDNKLALNHLLKIIQNEKLELFIRDVSFLGFPAFKLYIPTLSELQELEIESIETTFINSQAEKDILKLESLTKEQLENIANYLTSSLIHHNTSLSHSGILKRVNLNENCRLLDVDINFILVLIFIRLDKYLDAFDHLKKYINKNLHTKNSSLEYYMCVLSFLKYKSENKEDYYIRLNLVNLYDTEIVEEVLKDINSKKIFQYLLLPNAPNCNDCSIVDSCNYLIWKKITDSVLIKMENHFPKQNAILDVIF